jgi:hypothetical protein
MDILSQLFKQHPYVLAGILLIQYLVGWLTNNKATKIISALPMPTVNSSGRYVFWFKFWNGLVGNEARANLPPLERSPNFPAVKAQIEKAAVADAPPSA